MVVKMMRWRPWPPLVTKNYEVRLVVRRLEGWRKDLKEEDEEKEKLTVEIKWKGPKSALMSSLRKRVAVKRNFTKEVEVDKNDVVSVDWDEEFCSLCALTAINNSSNNSNGSKDDNHQNVVFHPWEISFTLFNGLNQGAKNKVPTVGTALLNLAEFASAAEQKEVQLSLPLVFPGSTAEPRPLLCISLGLLELRTAPETTESVQRAIVPLPSPTQSGETVTAEKDEVSAIKAGLRKVKIFTEYVSTRRSKKACREEEGSEGRCSVRSEEGEYNYPFDTDSLDDFEEGESDEVKADSSIRKSFSYGTLAYANCAGESFYSNMKGKDVDEDRVYYSNRKSDTGCSDVYDSPPLASEPYPLQSSKRSILPWRKRKMSFRSPKARGEPLLKKAYEEGGDDIDFDRRQLSSDEGFTLGWHKTDEDSSANRSSVSEFGDDNFAVGSWEHKQLTSRDGQMSLEAQVFFASIDQRSERAAGESACTALVAVIADWFQNNRDLMPIKSQFDSLIREGSLEWRNLCENETYMQRFPDKHFDLETVLQAKVRSLSVVPGKSFIGFFHPEGMDEGRFDFLHGAMSFDNIWDEISNAGSECSSNGEPQVYIVSWNDHFFVLKVEHDAYYIIDTLGERLYEGCSHAYILKFDSNTIIRKLPNAAQSAEEKTVGDQQSVTAAVEPTNQQQVNTKEVVPVSGAAGTMPDEPMNGEELTKTEEEGQVVCRGKESCKEYIKSFLAAIPIRELQADIKKGLMSSTPLHHRLQIEFHYTQYLQPLPQEAHAAEAPLPQEAHAAEAPLPQEAHAAEAPLPQEAHAAEEPLPQEAHAAETLLHLHRSILPSLLFRDLL